MDFSKGIVISEPEERLGHFLNNGPIGPTTVSKQDKKSLTVKEAIRETTNVFESKTNVYMDIFS